MTVSPAGLERHVDTCQGSIAIEGVGMHRLAWEAYDLSELWGTPTQRGRNRLLPGNPGTVAYAPRATETRFSLPFLVNGHWNPGGDYVAPGSIWSQLADNMEYLMTNVLLPTGSGGGTRTLVWSVPDGSTVTSEVQVLPSQAPTVLGMALVITTIELLAPDGDLHL